MLTTGKDFQFFDPYAEVGTTRANLPHWQQAKLLCFVTFRQVDSIPAQKLRDWRIDYDNWLAANPKPWNEAQVEEYEQHFARKIEHWLDANHGSCCLADSKCKQAVEEQLLLSNGSAYKLDEYVIASNHVHALLVPCEGHKLSGILKNWKGASARKINQLLGKNGTFWQKESYDHIVRNERALHKIRRYIQAHKS